MRRAALAYFGGQLLVLAALLTLSDSFVGLGFALIGQVFGVLRPRHWALPLVPLVALLAGPVGWLDLSAGSDWLGLASSTPSAPSSPPQDTLYGFPNLFLDKPALFH